MTSSEDTQRGPRPGAGLLALLRLLPSVSRPRTALVGGTTLVAGLLPVAFTIAAGIMVGAVPGAVAGGLDSPEGRRLLTALIVAAVLFVAEQVTGQVQSYLADALGRRTSGILRERAMAAALRPVGLAHLEDRDLADTISLARDLGPGQFTPGGAVAGLAVGAVPRIQMAVSALVVGVLFSWPLALVLLVGGAVSQVLLLRVFFVHAAVLADTTAVLRRSVYVRDLALTPGAAKEVRVFGLAGWLGARFTRVWNDAMASVWQQRRDLRGPLATVCILHGGVLGVGLLVVARAGVQGAIGVESLAVLLGAVIAAMGLQGSDNDIRAAYGAASVPALLRLEQAVAEPRFAAAGHLPALGMPTEAIRLEGVGFRYPGSERDVYAGLDLTIPAGQSLAIVGVNGAGKTTLVKLLARLYEPSAGRITVDGVPLAELDPQAWRRQLAVLFQDFVRYGLTAADNVAFGAVDADSGPAALARAAERAGAGEVVEQLAEGWDTILTRAVTGGADLSGGQWQRVALARALLAVDAGARVLVLDEPTANLDVRAEAELYDRFLDLTRGLTTILVSHRFSTVRRADRIVVLDAGRVVEDGSHDELLELGGRYAAMFNAQASRFADAPVGAPGPGHPAVDGDQREGEITGA